MNNINDKDIITIMDHMTMADFLDTLNTAGKLQETLKEIFDHPYAADVKVVYMYKLGVIHGKRMERAKRKKVLRSVK